MRVVIANDSSRTKHTFHPYSHFIITMYDEAVQFAIIAYGYDGFAKISGQGCTINRSIRIRI